MRLWYYTFSERFSVRKSWRKPFPMVIPPLLHQHTFSLDQSHHKDHQAILQLLKGTTRCLANSAWTLLFMCVHTRTNAHIPTYRLCKRDSNLETKNLQYAGAQPKPGSWLALHQPPEPLSLEKGANCSQVYSKSTSFSLSSVIWGCHRASVGRYRPTRHRHCMQNTLKQVRNSFKKKKQTNKLLPLAYFKVATKH